MSVHVNTLLTFEDSNFRASESVENPKSNNFYMIIFFNLVFSQM